MSGHLIILRCPNTLIMILRCLTFHQVSLLRSAQLVEFVDIFPTLVEAAGNAEHYEDHDGDDSNIQKKK